MFRFMFASSRAAAGMSRRNAGAAEAPGHGPALRVRVAGRPFLLLATGALVATACLSPATAQGLEPYEQELEGTLVKFEMVPIKGGMYTMPDPTKPGATRRTILKSFWISKTEVTWHEYDVYMYRLDETEEEKQSKEGAHGVSRPSPTYGPADRGYGHDGYAALGMTHYAAIHYCKWLSLKTGRKYRLPTEAEWEYACRAKVLPAGPLEDKALLDAQAWYKDNSEETPHPVAEKEANPWGLHDMLGNLAEWCSGLDGTPVVRGGSFVDPAEKVHPAAREHETDAWKESDPQLPKSTYWFTDAPFVGFRVVCEP
ncbi:MAG: formylglycine-generating enzyme family protein [Armatimonadota bacterium]